MYTPVDIADVPSIMIALQTRWKDRDERMDVMTAAVNGDFDVLDEQGDDVDNKSPNLVQVALEDTAEAASIVPSVRVKPSEPDAKDKASAMERIGTGILELSQIELLTIRTMMDLSAYGQISWIVDIDDESGSAKIQWRDPRTCYPEPGWHAMDSTRRAMFLREMYLTQLPMEWQEMVVEHVDDQGRQAPSPRDDYWRDHKVTLVEYYTEHEALTCALYKTSTAVPIGSRRTYVPVELHRAELDGYCQVIVNERVTLDTEPRGQFDQVIRVMKGHIQLMSTLLDYADQAVYSDVWVKDLIGTMPVGGGSYIQLGPQGSIGRVQPAVSSLQVFEELDRLMDGIHVGGRWPKTRPGEIDQSIASAKFVEATAGMMNTTIRTMHFIMKRQVEQALRVAFLWDKKYGRDRMISGILRNQQFMHWRKRDDIDLSAQVRAEYGLGLGREPAQSMVLGIQASQAGLVSTEFVQENFEGIQDVDMERRRIDVQGLRDMAMARLLEGMQSGEVPTSALTKIAKARMNGDDLFDLFDEYLVKPQEEMLDQQLTSGMDGSTMMPGAAPPMPGGAPPQAPPPEELLGGGPGGPGGEGPQLKSVGRTSVPFGNGSFAGVESRQ